MISQAQELLKPASGRFIALSLFIALTLDLLPVDGVLLLLRPDFLALVLLYWIVHRPMAVGIGIAWMFGLGMDVAEGNLFGQHALAYAVMAYATLALRRRILMFPLLPQALHVWPILLLMLGVTVLIKLFSGALWIGPLYFLSAFTGALLWPLLPSLLKGPQRRATPIDPA